MKVRSSKNIVSILEKKGFIFYKKKKHHQYYYLFVDGKKTHINTYISHGSNKDYHKKLMSSIKKQMKFNDNDKLDEYFDCTMDGDQYIDMLKEQNEI